MTSSIIVVHGTVLSGHTHRVENLLGMLGVPYRLEPAPAAVRQIPVLQDGELVLADSNAILVYLARRYGAGTRWLPDEPVAAARVQRWLSIAAGEVKYGPAIARILTLWGGAGDLTAAHAIAAELLAFMDGHLRGRSFLAADHATIADLACYPYLAHAPEGRISLADFPAVRAWIARVEALPGFRPMPVTAIPEGRS